MPRFRKRPVEIEATQWFPGVEVAGVEECPPEVIYSANGLYFYLSAMGADGFRADAWLATNPEDAAAHKADQVLPFAFFEVKSGKREKAEESNPLVRRYLERMGKAKLPSGYGLIDTLEGRMTVSPGDWVITGVKGEKYPCKPDIFEATYEAI